MTIGLAPEGLSGRTPARVLHAIQTEIVLLQTSIAYRALGRRMKGLGFRSAVDGLNHLLRRANVGQGIFPEACNLRSIRPWSVDWQMTSTNAEEI